MEELEQNKTETEQGLSPKEQYELRKNEKGQTKKKEQTREKMDRAPKQIGKYLLYALIVVVIIGGISWLISSIPNLPPIVMDNHIEKSPPTHIVTQPIPDRIQRHMLEHADGSGPSGVLIQYNCDDYECEVDMIEQLTSLVSEYPKNVYLAPNSYDGKIILTKLGELEILDSFDDQKIRDFIE